MDTCVVEFPGARTRSKSAPTEENPRPSLPSSGKKNCIPTSCKPRNVGSRNKSDVMCSSAPSIPKRCSSPIASHTSPIPRASVPKRSQSADRRRPATPLSRSSPSRPSTPSSPSRPSTPSSPSRPSTPSSPSSRSKTPVRDTVKEVNNTTRRVLNSKVPDGLWPSMRSLSSSFQSESLVVPVSKKDKLIANSLDKSIKSPGNVVAERKRTPLRGRNTSEQSENSRPLASLNTRVIDQHRWPGMMGVRLTTNAMSRSVDFSDKISRSSTTVSSRGVSPKRANLSSDIACKAPQLSLNGASEQLVNGGGRVEHMSSSQTSLRYTSVTRPSNTQTSKILGLRRPSSPSKVLSTSSSSSRGVLSPSRTRLSTTMSLSSNVTSRVLGTSSILKYNVDMQREKQSASRIDDVHQLKLLYSASLQWHFVNARAHKALSIQKLRTESILHSMWSNISELSDIIITKKIHVQNLQQEMKLGFILKGQMAFLEHWAALEKEHSSSLSGAVEALHSSILRLPVTEGAKADVTDVKNAVSSAVDVMQAMGSSICQLLFKVKGAKSLVSELSAVAAIEKSMLNEYRELLASTAAMQVHESSLRTQVMQLRNGTCKLY
ncbi:AUGMIN subunit 8-like [Canna indica]|uniref:AUGMIN subunit 8-like n=1 Tax=Canna indica TaxID=4628 RepID=A0AAQ3QGP8_9LILI|nr:AUGMIN subunit 8-like [Canna indica]